MADSQINVKITGSSNSAEQALDRVARKAENSLGKSISASLDQVKAKAHKVFGVEIPGLMDAAKSGAAFAGAAIGIEAAGRALKDMAVNAIKTTDQLTQLRARIDLIMMAASLLPRSWIRSPLRPIVRADLIWTWRIAWPN